MTAKARARHHLDRARGRLIAEADRRLRAHIGDYERLGRLTPIGASRGAPRLLFDTSDVEIGPRVWREAGYEEDAMAWILDHLGHPQRGRTVVDVGANIGTTTVPMLTRFGAAYVEAFEPAPDNARLLRCNLILNDLEDRVTFHPVAVSDAAASVTLELCAWNTGDHRVQAVDTGWELYGESDRRSVRVEAVRLDDHLRSQPGDVALVWVDTQGHEAHVLAGASKLLGAVPWVIEYWPYGLTRAAGLDRLHRLVAERFSTAVDVRRSQEREEPVIMDPADIPRVGAELGSGYTDFILLP
jgi:FkbM family methyltransferase